MPRIVNLPPLTEAAADADTLAMHNASVGDTEKITLSQLGTYIKTFLQAVTAWISPAMWTNPYKWSVYRAAAANTGNGAAAKITFDTEIFDTNNNFASGTYTVPVSGFYHVTGRFSVSASHTRIIIMAYVNGGSRHNGGDIHSAAIANGGVNISVLMQLVAGDTVEIWAYGNATLALEVGVGATANTYMQGYLVTPT